MNPSESEFEQLRARVAALEARVEALAAAREPAAAEPPIITPAGPAVAPAAATSVPGAAPAPAGIPHPRSRPAKPRQFNATTLIAGAGAVIFLIGALYGLTVAIQRGWISPPVRVFLGLITGVAFAGAAIRYLRDSRGLGVALLAAGAGTWTFAFVYGSRVAHLFPSIFGLAGAVVAVLGCGALGARFRADGAMAVALATGLVTPLVFWMPRREAPAVLAFLAALGGAQVAAHYLTRTGAGWRWSRVLGIAGLWWVAWITSMRGWHAGSAGTLGIMAGLGAISLVLAWLPRHPEQPWAPATGTAVALAALAVCAWPVWRGNGFEREAYAWVLAGLGGVSFGLIHAARRRTDGAEHDRLLTLLACGFGLVAVAVAWEWRWVVVAWGVAALLLAWLASARARDERPDAGNAQIAAGLVAAAATGVWLVLAVGQGKGEAIIANRVFLGAALTTAAWSLLARIPAGARGLAFAALQAVGVNALAWELTRAVPSLEGEEATLAVGPLLATLTYAVAGAGQWLRGMLAADVPSSRALRGAGYVWLAVAVAKLFVRDLAGTELMFRAIAALGVGGVFMGAAIWAGRRRAGSE